MNQKIKHFITLENRTVKNNKVPLFFFISFWICLFFSSSRTDIKAVIQCCEYLYLPTLVETGSEVNTDWKIVEWWSKIYWFWKKKLNQNRKLVAYCALLNKVNSDSDRKKIVILKCVHAIPKGQLNSEFHRFSQNANQKFSIFLSWEGRTENF